MLLTFICYLFIFIYVYEYKNFYQEPRPRAVVARRRIGSKSSAGGSVAADPSECCHVCNKLGHLTSKYRGKMFMQACKRGVEGRHRALKAGGCIAAVNRDIEEMLLEPQEWREKMTPISSQRHPWRA